MIYYTIIYWGTGGHANAPRALLPGGLPASKKYLSPRLLEKLSRQE